MDLVYLLKELNRIGIALSEEKEINSLSEKILDEAIRISNSEGGSIYLKEDDRLIFKVAKNRKLTINGSSLFFDKPIDINGDGIAAYTCRSGQIVNLEDAYNISPEMPYRFNKEYDIKNNYRTKSLLSLPMKDSDGEVFGVLELINAKDKDGRIIAYNQDTINIMRSLASQAAVAIKKIMLTEKLRQSYIETIMRLSIAAEYRDDDTGNHIKRISRFSEILAKKLGLSEKQIYSIKYGSPMHDVGKIGIRDSVLKKPGKLTNEEFDEIKTHTIIGARILSGSEADILKVSERIAISHHEKFDGSGYPYGLRGDEIPLEGRIVAVADVFDALTSKRCYKPAFSIEKSVDIIKSGKCQHFDPDIVDVFLDSVDEFAEIKAMLND